MGLSRKQKVLGLAGAAVLVAGAMAVPVRGGVAVSRPEAVAKGADLSAFSPEKPAKPLSIAFLHHSCGGQLLAPPGEEKGEHCIYEAHPYGGDLRAKLVANGYAVHEASYGSALGEDTDLFDWVPKFQTKLPDILRLARQDERLPEGEKNQIVVFKSCFPNNQFVGLGEEPGNAAGPALTVANAKATMRALRPLLEAAPETLFVYVTAPPIAPAPPEVPLAKFLLRAARGKLEPGYTAQQAAWARAFNDWVVDPAGWLDGYPGKNVVVFDYYSALTGPDSNLSAHATGEAGDDSHPAAEGNQKAAEAFVPLLNRAVRRAGLSP